ncbi:hypothetical protein [Thiothrix nivea]|uniref:Uncharacterized protein n=1 Tax=Thiothrix nivea (strain ATCC 35100 / DSM 5205 / JP2) TaxID=870187 RepID=A0A656HM34_THINJ|nr:hypothetical protein [Thiothrix nivea]EIJ36400.1 hypothetical protein Thini_3900 [Thiothrix nivea DSM 5205]
MSKLSCYVLNGCALEYVARQKLPKALLAQLEGLSPFLHDRNALE